MRDESKKRTTFSRRVFLLGGIQFMMFATVVGRILQLQLLEAGKYRMMSKKNRTRLSMIPPLRGIIYDRNNNVIAGNRNYTRLGLDEKNIAQIVQFIEQLNNGILSKKLHLNVEQIRDLVRRTPINSPVILINNLQWEDLAKLTFYRYKLDKASIEEAKRRFYPSGHVCSHVIGHTAPPTEKEMQSSNIPNYQDFTMGKNGLERTFESTLQGKPGFQESELNAKGILVRKISTTPSTPGSSLITSLSLPLQREVALNFAGKSGACVILNMKGEVLALYSSPSFDPNDFVGGIRKDNWDSLLNDPEKPLINRALSGAFPPGSTFKPVTALAALMSGVDPGRTVFCNGAHRVGNRSFHCSKRDGHGDLDIEMALAKSCNVYFYKTGLDIGASAIAKVSRILGLGSLSGIELPYEVKGNVPDRTWKLLRYQRNWLLGDTANTSIGQGYLLATPLQLAVMMARIASGMEIFPTMQLQQGKLEPLPIRSEYLNIVKNGLYLGINDYRGNNYAHRSPYPHFTWAGKTGTAQVASLAQSKGNRNLAEHGLFVGFAPCDNPQYAISCIVEHGVWGSTSALPIAKKLLLYLANKGVD